MRLDYVSYVVAVVCFLFAGIVFAVNPAYIFDTTIVYTLTAVLAILGVVLAGIGYSQRPKKTIIPPSAPEPTPTPAQQAQQVQQVQIAISAPTPTTTPPPEEPEKLQEETKPEKKAVRRRRKKA